MILSAIGRKQASHQNEAVPRARLRKCVPHGRERRCRVLFIMFSASTGFRSSLGGWTGEGGTLHPNIPKNHPKIHKTPQIIDLCYEWRVFVLLEMQIRYFHLTDFKRRENGFQVNPHLKCNNHLALHSVLESRCINRR